MKKALLTGAAVLASVMSVAAHAERDYISIVGSSTVYPFSTVVAERFGKSTDFRTPKVESTGSGGGLKLFCSGVGGATPDITNASRAIKPSEVELCAQNGVKDIVEITIGFDGITFANSHEAEQMSVTLKDLYLALAKVVPAADGSETLVDNPYKTWKDVNPALPNKKIEVLGPPPTSGTRDAFAELAMEGGCKTFPFIKEMKKTDKNKYKAVCHGVREDGAYIEAGENDNLIVQKLVANPDAFGIFGYSFLEENEDKVQGAVVNGKIPTFDNISDGSYPISRSLFFYVKKAHVGVIPGIKEYLAEFTSERAMGEDGYLSEKGMIPLTEEAYKKQVKVAKDLITLSAK
ncbi:MAG: phosphate ABC transporter substrate-binding protein [Oceanospirillaceae bacterium]|mgnify:FL=1|uniref:PstS family phosphate ABC transporter substrate-binding protein n=1 Tax=unclassified Thalassolituus TaxID=2624967 RepID=UPI000C3AF1AD|nr:MULTISPECIES: PstS family phosphate ABC transporter substrate-binding protein [unclassified Thalassolituus]MAS25479.1 phosphate ABC transporter substrate-binding protein [Oceanospirillaceae bacterium]MBS53781.1 phosphate ABC transporter substrate-binding protein [Oceanospirillaceae bacterium]